jgi:hypothetical protein
MAAEEGLDFLQTNARTVPAAGAPTTGGWRRLMGAARAHGSRITKRGGGLHQATTPAGEALFDRRRLENEGLK